MKRIVVLLTMLGLAAPAVAQAEAPAICIPTKASTAVKTPNAKGECPAENTVQYVVSQEDHEALEHMSFKAEGVNKKPTIYFSNVNVIVEGASESGEGNFGVGPESFGVGLAATASNNVSVGYHNVVAAKGSSILLVGARDESSGFANVVAGEENKIKGETEYAGIVGGQKNVSEGSFSFTGAGSESSVTSAAKYSAVIGGAKDSTKAQFGVSAGGYADLVEGLYGVSVGGREDNANGSQAAVVGGFYNAASAERSAVFGGSEGWAQAEGPYATITGGHLKRTSKEYEVK